MLHNNTVGTCPHPEPVKPGAGRSGNMDINSHLYMFDEPDQQIIANHPDFFENLTTKLQPIIYISPPLPAPLVFGFELLAHGLNGKAFGALLDHGKTQNIPPQLVRACLLTIQLMTVKHLSNLWQRRENIRTNALTFTVNLDHELLSTPYPARIFQRLLDAVLLKNTLFEISERCRPEDIPAIKALVSDYGTGIALDDGDHMPPTVRRDLLATAKLAKLDALTGIKLLKDRMHHDPKHTIQEMERHLIKNKPFVIEGIETENDLLFLTRHWPQKTLLGQGFHIQPGQPYNKYLKPIKNKYGICGYLPKEKD